LRVEGLEFRVHPPVAPKITRRNLAKGKQQEEEEEDGMSPPYHTGCGVRVQGTPPRCAQYHVRASRGRRWRRKRMVNPKP